MPECQTSRRSFLSILPGLAASGLFRSPGETVLDCHQHSLYNGRAHEELIAHQAANRIGMTLVMPGGGPLTGELGTNEDCFYLVSAHPEKFVRFASCDPADPRSVSVLTEHIRSGALGIGAMKYRIAVDAPEMRRVYDVARELRLPVHLHFQGRIFNEGIERLEPLLKAYSGARFICHGPTWWAHISARVDPDSSYPRDAVRPGGLADRLLSDYENVYGDLSAQSGLNALTRDPDFAYGFLGKQARKLIWGSDCECRDGKGGGTANRYCTATRSLSMLAELTPDKTTFRRIVYDNGAALLKLK